MIVVGEPGQRPVIRHTSAGRRSGRRPCGAIPREHLTRRRRRRGQRAAEQFHDTRIRKYSTQIAAERIGRSNRAGAVGPTELDVPRRAGRT